MVPDLESIISGSTILARVLLGRSVFMFTHMSRLTMKSLLVVIACLVLTAQCAIYFIVQDEVPGHENQCYDEIDGSFCNPRDRMRSDNDTCSRVTCLGRYEDEKILIEQATCGVVMVMPGCELVEDLSKPYPECCPQIVCPDDLCNETGVSE